MKIRAIDDKRKMRLFRCYFLRRAHSPEQTPLMRVFQSGNTAYPEYVIIRRSCFCVLNSFAYRAKTRLYISNDT